MKNHYAAKTAFLGLMFSLALVLNILEGMIPPIASLPPGVKLGLSNIVTMMCVILFKKSYAFVIAGLKGVFVMLSRGAVAGALSLCGGLCSVLVMVMIIKLTKNKSSYLLLSISGAIAHNLAQILIASLILQTSFIYYLPVLVISGIAAGIITSAILRLLMPYIKNIKLPR